MPTTIYPLCFNEHIFDTEISSRETADGIYLSIQRFSQFMNVDDETVVVLELKCGDRTVYAHICGSHSDDDATVYAPSWMCQILRCEGGEEIEMRQCAPSMGLKITIQPHTSEYATLDDPVSALRNAFENYACLVSGIDIPLNVAGSRLIVSIVDTGFEGPICIRGVELEVEIQTPLDSESESELNEMVSQPVNFSQMISEPVNFSQMISEPVNFSQMISEPVDFSQMISAPVPVDKRFPGVGRRLG